MRQLSPIEMDKAEALKDARAFIRRKHARACDRELNEKLPVLEMAIDAAIQGGKELTRKQLEALIGGE